MKITFDTDALISDADMDTVWWPLAKQLGSLELLIMNYVIEVPTRFGAVPLLRWDHFEPVEGAFDEHDVRLKAAPDWWINPALHEQLSLYKTSDTYVFATGQWDQGKRLPVQFMSHWLIRLNDAMQNDYVEKLTAYRVWHTAIARQAREQLMLI